jgi:hypothetical protein
MYKDVHNGFQKVENSIPSLRAFKRAAMLGVVLPTGDTLDTFLPTYLYIAIVSILDDALEEFIGYKYPTAKAKKLSDRIAYLKARGHLKDAVKLENIVKNRNDYAHEHMKYAGFSDTCFQQVYMWGSR